MSKSRARPLAAEAATLPPPAKRQKGLPAARTKGFANILLDPKGSKKLASARVTKSHRKDISRVDDERAVVRTANGHGDVEGPVAAQTDVVDISSDSSSDDGDDEGEPVLQNGLASTGIDGLAVQTSLEADLPDEGLENQEPGEEDEDRNAEASFGERLRSQYAEPIDVEAALAKVEDDSSESVGKIQKKRRIPPTVATFSTVLAQSLRTDDKELMESCFEMADLGAVKETLIRIDSRYVPRLLTRIAAVVSAKPGRLGALMIWIQWGIVAHGGYLAGQPDFVKTMGPLLRIIEERASGLQPLLQLKGKLDMLSSQLDLRREMQERSARDDEVEEGAVTVYVEADEDASNKEDSASEAGSGASRNDDALGLNGIDDSSDEDEEMGPGPFAGGAVKADASDSEDSDDDEELFDEEAKEAEVGESSEEDDEEEDNSD